MAEVQQQQQAELSQALQIADALAAERAEKFPDDFLTDLQNSDPTLFKDFLSLGKANYESEETQQLLGQLGAALKDFNQMVEDAKPSEAKDFAVTMEAIGMNDAMLGKFYGYMGNLPSIPALGVPYANTNLMYPGYKPSYETDLVIAADMKKAFPKLADLVAAYKEVLKDPKKDPNKTRWVKEAADFLAVKGYAFLNLRAKNMKTAADKKAGAVRETELQETVDVDMDRSMADLMVDAEEAISKIKNSGDLTLAAYYNGELSNLRKIANNPSDDPEQAREDETSFRRFCAELFLAAEATQKVQTTEPQPPAPGESAPARVASSAAVSSARVEGTAVNVAAAPEARVDYMVDAREHPEKYLTESTGDTSVFKAPNRKAELAIRIEDLYGKDTEKPDLTSSRYPGLTFKYGSGADGNSWYDLAGSGKRLAILNGDTLKEVKVEPALVAAAPEAPVVPGTEVVEAPVESPVAAPEVAQMSAPDLKALAVQLSNDQKFVQNKEDEIARLEKKKKGWFSNPEKIAGEITSIRKDIEVFSKKVDRQKETLLAQKDNPAYKAVVADHISEDVRLALNLPGEAAVPVLAETPAPVVPVVAVVEVPTPAPADEPAPALAAAPLAPAPAATQEPLSVGVSVRGV